MTESADETDGERAALFVAFAGGRRIASGTLATAALAARRALDRDDNAAVLVFSRETGEVVDLDLRGTEPDIVARLGRPPESAPRRGRPKLGVVAREVTLLPRHWEWLARQPGGASVALRKLVEAARKLEDGADEARARREAAYRFMSAMGGDLPGFEEAARALFAGDLDQLRDRISAWPPDIREQALRFAGG
jgi:uncharacterized protein